jgi:adenine/guanine phosphoribosyltransferase-like PRPP-binding protein
MSSRTEIREEVTDLYIRVPFAGDHPLVEAIANYAMDETAKYEADAIVTAETTDAG